LGDRIHSLVPPVLAVNILGHVDIGVTHVVHLFVERQRPRSFLAASRTGPRTLRGLKLPAIDLSAIGKACGGQIDGILGVDLLDQMGMTIDLKRRVAVTAPAGEPGEADAENRDLRQLLWHRHRLVQMRTRVMNQLHVVALNEGLRRKKALVLS
jgi:hypothetical protein